MEDEITIHLIVADPDQIKSIEVSLELGDNDFQRNYFYFRKEMK